MSLLSPSLEAFWAVVQKGTVLEAAKMVHLTQTGVTQRIRSLEKQLGVTLFTRSRKGMRLTTEGESLLRYVQAARDLESDTLLNLSGQKKPATIEVRISGPSAFLQARAIPRLAPVIKKFPQLLLRFDFSDQESVLGKLKSGFTHLGVLPPGKVGPELTSQHLPPLRHALVGPTAWKKRKVDDILAKEPILSLSESDVVPLNLLRKMKRHQNLSPHRHFANDLNGLTALTQIGAGYSALPLEFARPHIKDGSLLLLSKEHFLDEAIALAWYPRNEMPPYFKSLIAALSQKSPSA